MPSKTNPTGWLFRDDRCSGGKLEEFDTLTCSHCQKQLLRNPLRIRERGYCPKCDHYVCDECEAIRVKTGQCVTFKEVMDIVQEDVEHGRPISPIVPFNLRAA